MGTKDVYIKGVNALNIKGAVGILTGNLVEGGTIGRVYSASKRKGFSHEIIKLALIFMLLGALPVMLVTTYFPDLSLFLPRLF